MANCIEEEVNLLDSYFCLNGELCHVISKHLISIRMKLLDHDLAADDAVKNQCTQSTPQGTTQDTTQGTTLSLSFDLPPDYPLVNPSVSVQCSHPGFTRSLAMIISDLLKDEALTLIGMYSRP